MSLKRLCVFLLIFCFTLTFTASVALSAVLFSDDFNNNSINTTKWNYGGNLVVEEDGIMKMEQNITDAGGWLYTKDISFNRTGVITINMKNKLHYANENYFPATNFYNIGDSAYWYISYCHTAYGNQFKFYIVRHDTTGYHVMAETDPVWDAWFNEKIEYDPVSGLVKYYINDELRMQANVGPFATDFDGKTQIAMSAYGWYTGHYRYIDDFEISQIYTQSQNNTITASAGANGTISPSGSVSVNYGADQKFDFTPAAGYHVADVVVDNVSQGATPSYTFPTVTTDHTIAVTFAINTYTITASAGANGSISPSGSVSVNYGADQKFDFTPATGYQVVEVVVDNVSQGAINSYTFNNVTTDHTIAVTFVINIYSQSPPVWVPLYRLYKYDAAGKTRDHFYTANVTEKNFAISSLGYLYEGIEGYVSSCSFAGSAPLYRVYNNLFNSHYYCTSDTEKSEKITLEGYADEGVAGYVCQESVPGLVAMHRLQQPLGSDTPYHYVLCTKQQEYSFLTHNYTGDTVIGYLQPQGLKDHVAHSRPQGTAGGVDLGSGAFRGPSSLDLNLKGRGPNLSFSHYYNSFNFHTYPNNYPMGPGWSHNLESYVIEDASGNVYVKWVNDTVSAFTKTGPGISDYRDESGAHDLMSLINDGVNYGYSITKKNQTRYEYRRFNVNPAPGQTIQHFLQESGQDTMISLIYIEDWAGNRLSFNREASYATLLSVYDNLGRELKFTYYYPQCSLQKVDEVINGVTKRSISFTYDDKGNLATFTDAKGNVTRYSYDDYHQLTNVTYPAGNPMTVGYNAGKTVSVKVGNDAPTVISYEPIPNTNTITATVIDPLENVFTYLHEVFKLSSQNGPDLNLASFVYADPKNPNQPTHVEDKEGNPTDFEYDPMGNLTKITNASGKVALFTYNSKNNLTSRTDFHTPGNSSIVPTIYGYNNSGTADVIGNHLESVTNPEIETTLIHYNSNHQVDWIQNPLGYTTSYQYDSYGNLSQITGPENNTSQFYNDYAGRTTRVVDADGKGTNYTYDANDNLNIITDHTSHQISLTPDINDNLSKVSWLNNGQPSQTNYIYDFQNRLQQISNPLALASSFTYNPSGSLKTRTDFNGVATTYDYDTKNRLKSITYPSYTVIIARNNNGSITSVSSPSGSSGFQYNVLNLVKSYTDPYGMVVQYDYNAAGRLWHLTYPGGKVVTYGYDRDGRLKTVEDMFGGITTYSYDAAGNLKEIQRRNGTRAVYTYDRASRLKGITETTSGGSVICSYSHILSAAGDIQDTTMTEPLAGIPPSSATTLNYDQANRLQSTGSTTFTYDNNGNRTGKTASGQTTIFGWNYENLLSSVAASGKTVQHLYDGMNNRIARKVNETTTRYVLDVSGDMSQVLAETDGGGNIQAYYVYGLGLVSRITPAGTRQFYHYNQRGDTIALTDNAGNITDSYAYDPYGKLLASQGTMANPFKFVGRYGVMDEGDDLYFMRARFYDGGYGRFLSEDPIGFSGGDWNLFSYGNSNPILNIDPSGHKPRKSAPTKPQGAKNKTNQTNKYKANKDSDKKAKKRAELLKLLAAQKASSKAEQDLYFYDQIGIGMDWACKTGGVLVPPISIGYSIGTAAGNAINGNPAELPKEIGKSLSGIVMDSAGLIIGISQGSNLDDVVSGIALDALGATIEIGWFVTDK